MSSLFEIAASRILDCPLNFDGAVNLSARLRKPRQIRFDGKMWLLRDKNHVGDWFESFEATGTDKRITKQGLWINIRVGEYIGEGDLLEILK